MYGRVDRGGSREGKKSLRKNKVFVHVVKTKHEQWLANQNRPAEAVVSAPAPPLRPLAEAPQGTPALVDAFCNLVSRKLSEDLDRVVRRAHQAGVQALITQSPDAEKQEALLEVAGQFLDGQVLCIVGVHPDNTKKTHDAKAIAQRVASLRTLALKPQTVAISAGIDLQRDISTHFPQEKLLQALVELAGSVQLPLVLSAQGGSAMAERIISNVREGAVGRIALVHFGGMPADLLRVREELGDVDGVADEDGKGADEPAAEQGDDAGEGDDGEGDSDGGVQVYYVVTGALCDQTELGEAEKALALSMPLQRLLLASDSPHYTPQTIPDPWIRENRNEPSTLPFVLKQLASLLQMADEGALAAQLHSNTQRFFGLTVGVQDASAAAPAAASPAASSSASRTASTAEAASTPSDDTTGKAKASKASPAPAPAPTPAPAEGKGKAGAAATRPSKDRKPVERPKPQSESPEPAARVPSPVAEPSPSPAPVPQQVQYACKRCRFVLHTAAEQIPHHRLLHAKDDGVSCQTLFFTRPTWLAHDSSEARDGGDGDGDGDEGADDDDDDDDDADEADDGALGDDEGKLACPKCAARLGRYRLVGSAPVECSCGAQKPPPAFAYAKKRLDVVLPIEDARAAMVSLRLQDETRQAEAASDDEDAGASKKKKRQKKQKKTNAANFSSFRNKSYGVKTPTAKKAEAAEASGDDDA